MDVCEGVLQQRAAPTGGELGLLHIQHQAWQRVDKDIVPEALDGLQLSECQIWPHEAYLCDHVA